MWQNFEKYIGVEGVIALILVGAVCWLAVAGMKIPAVMANLAYAAAAFYFGTKKGAAARLIGNGKKPGNV